MLMFAGLYSFPKGPRLTWVTEGESSMCQALVLAFPWMDNPVRVYYGVYPHRNTQHKPPNSLRCLKSGSRWDDPSYGGVSTFPGPLTPDPQF